MELRAHAAAARAGRVRGEVSVVAFATAGFTAAALVFLVEPMSAKLLLPRFGGSASVWITAMVFFQAVLLAGYGYAHVSTRLLGDRQPLVHLGVLAAPLALLPVGLRLDDPPAGIAPEVWLLAVLAVSVGPPFFALTSAAPLLQRWFSRSSHRTARDPYYLYAAGNVGSLVGLLAYPLVVEPFLDLGQQTRLWSAAYVTFVLLTAGCAVWVSTRRAEAQSAVVERGAIPRRQRLRWVGFAFVPSSLMLGVTLHITTDVASAPLLWVIPLAVYLLSFVVAFSRVSARATRLAGLLLPFAVAAIFVELFQVVLYPPWLAIAIHVVGLFCAATLCHGRLNEERPPADHLTTFYFAMSIGGVLGGVFNALVAPQIFDTVLEYPVVLALALLARPEALERTTRRARTIDIRWALAFTYGAILADVGLAFTGDRRAAATGLGVAVLASLVFVARPRRHALAVVGLLVILIVPQLNTAERTFYGVYKVTEQDGRRLFVHGTTVHGAQSLDARHALLPLTYYSRPGPAGDVFLRDPRAKTFRDVYVLGLGVGSLAAYGVPGQAFTFFEIDPTVVRIARDTGRFTFLANSKASVQTVVGDGRRSLEHVEKRADVLVLDAFSSDAIPLHLLTEEAFALYADRVKPDGLILANVSNRHLELAPLVAATAGELGMATVRRFDEVTRREADLGFASSEWVAVARKESTLRPLVDVGWKPVSSSDARPWTDGYSNLLSVVRW